MKDLKRIRCLSEDLGSAIVLLSLLLGIGGCSVLCAIADKHEAEGALKRAEAKKILMLLEVEKQEGTRK